MVGKNPSLKRQSDFIVYVDESGDHSISKIDEKYPVFVLAFCVFYQQNYIDNVVSAVERLKFEQFGHDIVVLHEREIRKEAGPFKFRSKDEKEGFLDDLTRIIAESNFILIAAIIDKKRYGERPDRPVNPYHIALRSCLDGLNELMTEKRQTDRETHIVFESRGSKEDRELELEFRRICAGEDDSGGPLPYRIVIADKKVNSTGLQLADLVARPIGLRHLRPDQPNRAFGVLKEKFLCRGGRSKLGIDFEGWGLRIHPS